METHQNEEESAVPHKGEDELTHPSLLREDGVDFLINGGQPVVDLRNAMES
jgi:hypothetical protein